MASSQREGGSTLARVFLHDCRYTFFMVMEF